MRTILAILLSALAVAQQPAAQEEPIFRSDTRLVVQQVSVKDKDGKPIEGLTAKDFVVAENGVVQTLAFAEFQKLEEIQPAPVLNDRVDAIPRLAHSQIAAERPLIALPMIPPGRPLSPRICATRWSFRTGRHPGCIRSTCAVTSST